MIGIDQKKGFEELEENRVIIYELGLKSTTKVRFWSDGTMTIEGQIQQGFVRVPKTITDFIALEVNKLLPGMVLSDKQTTAIEIVFKERRIKGILRAYQIREGKTKKILMKKNKGKKIHLFLTANLFRATELLESIQVFVEDGGKYSSIQKFLEEPAISQQLSFQEKIAWIKKYHSYLTRKPAPAVTITFGKEQIKLFNDPIVAAQIKTSQSKGVSLPFFITQILLQTNSHVVYLRSNTLFMNILLQGKYGKKLSTAFTDTTITLFWGYAVQKTDLFQKIIQLKTKYQIIDPRLYLSISAFSNRNDKPQLLQLVEDLASQQQIIPLIQYQKQTSAHIDSEFEQKIKSLLFESYNSSEYFLFEEALLASKDGTWKKVVDFFLLCRTNFYPRFTFELRTLDNFKYKTRKLKQAIAEYSYLRERVPEAGIPVILINWVATQCWRDYASSFGLLILDAKDITQLNNLSDLIKLLNDYSTSFLYSKVPRRWGYREEASQLVERWLEEGKIPWEDIGLYSRYLGFTIGAIKHLLTQNEVMNGVDIVNRYHNHKPVVIDNPQALRDLHKRLLQEGNVAILKEELFNCRKQIAKIIANPKIADNYRRSINRRRETFDLAKLLALEQDLTLILSLQQYWGPLDPRVIRLYYDSKSDGRAFEKAIYSMFQRRGYQTIRHLTIKVGQRDQEIDLVAFLINTSGQLVHRCIISCTDKSTINSKALKAVVKMKYQLLANVLKALKYTFEGLLFVQLSKVHSAIIEELKEFYKKHAKGQIKVVFVFKEEVEQKTASFETLDREVSFESIYIVRVEIRVKATKRGVKISANIVELWVKRKKRREKKKRGGGGYLRGPLLMTA
ncbi:MAG: hypothetical protein K9W42_00105 [Candidatus Heimdallarchaeota archaeon]|nr:hypothetical protein [Candidatus Heimdallarchaeota archaeon]